jgi:hypothetical protein
MLCLTIVTGGAARRSFGPVDEWTGELSWLKILGMRGLAQNSLMPLSDSSNEMASAL